MAICLLLRHGHSTANAAGILSGRAPGVTLTDRGRAEADALGAALAELPVVGLHTSPLERCLETAAAVSARHSSPLAVTEAPGLVEVGYGAWTNRPLRELADEPLWGSVQREPATVVFPASEEHEAEGIAEMAERVLGTVRAIDADVEAVHGANAVWLAVSHGDPIKAVLADAAGASLGEFQRFVVEPAGVVAIRYTAERTFVLGHNLDPARLAALVGSTGHSADGAATPGGSTGAG
jgi:2,3-bisphosphoglycerate-dependent phosphoglycerate mutase